MKHILATTLFSVVLLTGCTKYTDTLGTIQETVAQTRISFQIVIDNMCREFAVACGKSRNTMLITDDACEAFEICDGFRQHTISIFEHINLLIADANLSATIGDSKSADEVIIKVFELLEQLRKQMRVLGYLK